MKDPQKPRLIAYFRQRCQYRMQFPDGNGYYCNLKYQSRCKHQDSWFVDFPDCPETCPHHIRRLPIGCNDDTKCKKLELDYKDLRDFLQS